MFGKIIFILIAIFVLFIIMVGAAAITILIREALFSEMDKENSTSVVNKARKDTTRINK